MKKKNLVIATRKSPLALWQANWVKIELLKRHPRLTIDIVGLTTQADNRLVEPLYHIGGKGLFVKELEEALFDGRADMAVHSAKDVPMELPKGLRLAVLCKRDEARDALVSNQYASLKDLPKQAKIGTSSLRRQSQLLSLRPDLNMVPLRGNVNTRLAKLDNQEFAAIILAAAGLKRLNMAERIRRFLSMKEIIPAAGQGVLAIETRDPDTDTQAMIAPLHHEATGMCVTAERAMCRRLGGGCQVPIAAYAEKKQNQIYLHGLVANRSGTRVLRAVETGSSKHPEQIGARLAEVLLRLGAEHILHD